MPIIADTHVHLYSHFDIRLALTSLASNLHAIDADATRVGCLAEAAACDAFEALRSGELTVDGLSVQALGDAPVLKVTSAAISALYLVAGRQIIAEGGIEILGLGVRDQLPDRETPTATIDAILEKGGIPVLSWAPGKWLGARGKVIAGLLTTLDPKCVVLGDTSLRPVGYLEPLLFRAAAKRGFRIIAGSDPLLGAGEEQLAGRYASRVIGELDVSMPWTSIKAALLAQGLGPDRVGHRGPLLAVAKRLWAHRKAKPAAIS